MSYLLIKATNAHHVNENIPIVFKLITIYFDKHRLFSTYQFSSELSTVFNTRQMGQSTVQPTQVRTNTLLCIILFLTALTRNISLHYFVYKVLQKTLLLNNG